MHPSRPSAFSGDDADLRRVLQAIAGIPSTAAPSGARPPSSAARAELLQAEDIVVGVVRQYMKDEGVEAIPALNRLIDWLGWGRVEADPKKPGVAVLHAAPGLSPTLRTFALLVIDHVLAPSRSTERQPTQPL